MIQVNDAIREACLARLKHAKTYNKLHEVNDADKLIPLISKAPGGSALDIQKDGWCAHAVGGIDAELGYAPYGGTAAGIADFQVEISEAIPGCTVAMHGHAAFQDEDPDYIYGGNQSQKFCSQHKRFYRDAIGFYVPREIAALADAEESDRYASYDNAFVQTTPRKQEQLASVGADVEEVVQETKSEVSEVAKTLDAHFKWIDDKLEAIDDKLDQLDKRLANIENYLSQFSADND